MATNTTPIEIPSRVEYNHTPKEHNSNSDSNPSCSGRQTDSDERYDGQSTDTEHTESI